MDYLLEALKFIERARNALDPDVVRTDLEMARWLLSQAINEKERGFWSSAARFRLAQSFFSRPLTAVA